MERGVELFEYRGQADVLLLCGRCTYSKVLPLEAVIARLNKRGRDGEKVGIVELARFTRQACQKCGSRRWETRPAFHGVPGQMGLPSVS